MKRKRTLLKIFLIPILAIVLLQGLMPYIIIVTSGIRSSLTDYAVSMDSHVVENSRTDLENNMVDHWRRSVNENSSYLVGELETVLSESGAEAGEFLASEDLQQKYLAEVASEMIDSLQYSTTSGMFIVLANDGDISSENTYEGFFMRDSDPQSRVESNSDLLFERGSKELSQTYSISLDSGWTTDFEMSGEGVRTSDSFFYEPYMAALSHIDTDAEDLGYWSTPFVLSDSDVDSHSMITYSIPIVYDGQVYGVYGVEISLSYLTSYFQVEDLDSDYNAGYAVAVRTGDGSYTLLCGKGTLYDNVLDTDGGDFSTAESGEDELCQVNEAAVGGQDIYTVIKELNIYSSNVPYENTDWVLCGFVTEESVYGLSETITVDFVMAIVVSLVFGVILAYLLTHRVTRPVYRLVAGVRGGIDGIRDFETSHISEIDELHDVIENLMESQLESEQQMKEEKERYRLAVESSDDIFFTYHRSDNSIELVNSRIHDGVWDIDRFAGLLREGYVHPDDIDALLAFGTDENAVGGMEIRLRLSTKEEFEWYSVSQRLTSAENGGDRRMVGCIHNINQRKQLEEIQKNRQIYDEVTSFYRMGYGTEAIAESGKISSKGVLVMLDVVSFMDIYSSYGLLFGDVLLEQLAAVVRNETADISGVIYVRAGMDQFLVWLPGSDIKGAKAVFANVRKSFSEFVDEKYLALDFRCGYTQTDSVVSVDKAVSEVRVAVQAAKDEYHSNEVYQQLSREVRQNRREVKLENVVSLGRAKDLSITSLALNLLDRSSELAVILDILVLKLSETYGVSDLIITWFDREYLTNSVSYRHIKPNSSHGTDIIHCTENDYQTFIDSASMQELKRLDGADGEDTMLGQFAGDCGVAYHMLDSGMYSGSIIFLGETKGFLAGEGDMKDIEGIASVIQSRVNLKRHDMAAQAKSDFLARMSHEIRTPMNGIIGMTDIALRENQTEERRIDCLKKIKSSSDYMLGLLNDILDMSKIESGKMKLVLQPFDLQGLIDGLEVVIESKIREKNIHFEQEISLSHSYFVGDELRLNQVLVNFLSNAVKYAGAGGHIRLTVIEKHTDGKHSEIYFAVRDDGVGIEKDKQKLIFKRFEQADTSRNARTQGTGLGLAICSRLVHMMDSDINLESAPGRGSCFSFTVKLERTEPLAAGTVRDADSYDFTGRRLLVCEDNDLNMEIVVSILGEMGITVVGASDGREAVKLMKESEPGYYDLVLMDIMMPVMDGFEATRQIRKIDREDCKNIPIVAMSANAFDEDVKQSIACGMNAHLAKPVNTAKLRETLAEMLGMTREQ